MWGKTISGGKDNPDSQGFPRARCRSTNEIFGNLRQFCSRWFVMIDAQVPSAA